MNSRVKFQEFLETLTPNVYFQPPSNTSIKYPAIVYTRNSISKFNANNVMYKKTNSYNVTVMDKNPDSIIADELLKLRYCEFDRQFASAGINNIVFKIYY